MLNPPKSLSRSVPRHERVIRVLVALSLGPLGAVRGCGGGTVCDCTNYDAGDGEALTCTPPQLDAGCRLIGQPSGPLWPPSLDA
ncbi:MAG: hypothetical protein Q8Q09_04585 [Deltaproteobacteria bacterium]|nr:hypothetical protein [Deltaproteobacteria bacterium]